MMLSTVSRSIGACLFAAVVLTLFSTPAFAQPAEVTVTQEFVMTPTVINPCNGDVIIVTGGHTVQLTRTSTSNGFKLLSHLTSIGTGTALVNQHQYHLGESNLFEVNASGVVGQFEETQIVSEKMIGPGPTEDFFMEFLLHLTVNAAGVPSAFVGNPTFRCH